MEAKTVPSARQVLRVLVIKFLKRPTVGTRVRRWLVNVYRSYTTDASVVVQVLRQFDTRKCGIEKNDRIGVVKYRVAEKGVVYKAIHIVHPQ